jgi:hypothetical protein
MKLKNTNTKHNENQTIVFQTIQVDLICLTEWHHILIVRKSNQRRKIDERRSVDEFGIRLGGFG